MTRLTRYYDFLATMRGSERHSLVRAAYPSGSKRQSLIRAAYPNWPVSDGGLLMSRPLVLPQHPHNKCQLQIKMLQSNPNPTPNGGLNGAM